MAERTINVSDEARAMLRWYGTYREFGWRDTQIILLEPGKKERLSPGDFEDDVLLILEGKAQLGLIMSGCHFALDFDNEATYQQWAEANPGLKNTATAKTPNGYHVLFQVPHQDYSPPSGKGPVVDVIADGWWIAVHPSSHPSGKMYQWETYPTQPSIYTVQNVDVVLNSIDADAITWNVDNYNDYDYDEWEV